MFEYYAFLMPVIVTLSSSTQQRLIYQDLSILSLERDHKKLPTLKTNADINVSLSRMTIHNVPNHEVYFKSIFGSMKTFCSHKLHSFSHEAYSHEHFLHG